MSEAELSQSGERTTGTDSLRREFFKASASALASTALGEVALPSFPLFPASEMRAALPALLKCIIPLTAVGNAAASAFYSARSSEYGGSADPAAMLGASRAIRIHAPAIASFVRDHPAAQGIVDGWVEAGRPFTIEDSWALMDELEAVHGEDAYLRIYSKLTSEMRVNKRDAQLNFLRSVGLEGSPGEDSALDEMHSALEHMQATFSGGQLPLQLDFWSDPDSLVSSVADGVRIEMDYKNMVREVCEKMSEFWAKESVEAEVESTGCRLFNAEHPDQVFHQAQSVPHIRLPAVEGQEPIAEF